MAVALALLDLREYTAFNVTDTEKRISVITTAVRILTKRKVQHQTHD